MIISIKNQLIYKFQKKQEIIFKIDPRFFIYFSNQIFIKTREEQ